MKLAGRTALVFGAGSAGPGWGNGKAAAVLYAREGARVVAVDLNEAAAAETQAIITDEGGTAIALAGNVTRAGDIDAVIARTLAEFGRIDVLHNNVGITDMGGLDEITEERWKRVMDINLTGVFLTCKAVVPVMLRQGGGAIINISSIAGSVINRYPYFSYYASKAGLNHFTRALAVQYRPPGHPRQRRDARHHGHTPGARTDRRPIRRRRRHDARPRRHEPDGPPRQRLGRGTRLRVPGLRRGGLYYRGLLAGGWGIKLPCESISKARALPWTRQGPRGPWTPFFKIPLPQLLSRLWRRLPPLRRRAPRR